MDQLINMITKRTGISADKARGAVNMVLEFLKEKLPAPVAAQVESLLGGQGTESTPGMAEKVLGGLGGFFGKKD